MESTVAHHAAAAAGGCHALELATSACPEVAEGSDSWSWHGVYFDVRSDGPGLRITTLTGGSGASSIMTEIKTRTAVSR